MAKDKVVFPNFYSLWSLAPAYIFGKRAALVKATPRWRVNQTANGPFNHTQLLRTPYLAYFRNRSQQSSTVRVSRVFKHLLYRGLLHKLSSVHYDNPVTYLDYYS
jgi:hypothetical protein